MQVAAPHVVGAKKTPKCPQSVAETSSTNELCSLMQHYQKRPQKQAKRRLRMPPEMCPSGSRFACCRPIRRFAIIPSVFWNQNPPTTSKSPLSEAQKLTEAHQTTFCPCWGFYTEPRLKA